MCNNFPVVASQTLAVLSQLPVTIRWPSGKNATDRTGAVCPFERKQFLAARRIPDLCGMIRAAGDNPLAIRRIGHGQNRPGVSAKRL